MKETVVSPVFSREDIFSVIGDHNEDEIRQAVRSLDYLKTSPHDSALAVAQVILLQSREWEQKIKTTPEINRTDTAFERKICDLLAENKRLKAGTLHRWLLGAGIIHSFLVYYPLFLFNSDFADARSIFDLFIEREITPPPYMGIFGLNLFRQVLGLSHTEIKKLIEGDFYHVAHMYRKLFADARPISHWMEIKKQPLQFYGGGPSNIRLGFYDRYFADHSTSFHLVNRTAERAYDLGGGFNTSEIESLLGRRCISADIVPPSLENLDPDIIIQKTSPIINVTCLDDVERERYLLQQSRVEYTSFDVFKNSFPTDANSYVITSMGFVASTVRSKSNHVPGSEQEDEFHSTLNSSSTSMHGIYRVLELVAKGKDVDFMTVQRATGRVFKYRTCFFQWRLGRLVSFKTTEDYLRQNRLRNNSARAYELINPQNSPFIKYG